MFQPGSLPLSVHHLLTYDFYLPIYFVLMLLREPILLPGMGTKFSRSSDVVMSFVVLPQ